MDIRSADASPFLTDRRRFVAHLAGIATAIASGPLVSIRANDLVATSCCPSANKARLLSDDATSLIHRLMLIDAAQCEVLISAYEVGDDCVALKVLAALRQAARRGVNVKLMVDGHRTNNLIPKAMMEHLIQESVAVREHLPDVRYQLELGRQRMHDKLLIVDSQRMIIGGRNIRADYYGLSCNRDMINRWDREAYITGPISHCVRDYYLKRWSAETSGQPSLDRDEQRKTAKEQQLAYLNEMPRSQAIACAAKLLDEALATPLPYSSSCCDHHALDCKCESFFELDCVRFLHDQPQHDKECPEAIASQINLALGRAKQHALISTPYLVVTRDLKRILLGLRERGVEIILLTNSLSTNDHTITHAQYVNERRWMMRSGIDVWEMHGDRMLHAKSMVIDGCRSMIGSYNFDVLSETRNSETALLIDDVPFAEALTAQIVGNLMMAVPVDEPLRGFDARTNDVDQQTLRKLRTQRLISPWIKRYL